MIPGTIRGQIEFLKLQERTTYNTFDYLQFVDARTLTQDTTNNIGASASGRINQKWRRVISQWVYDGMFYVRRSRNGLAFAVSHTVLS